MRILIVGSGGREDALAWKLKQSPAVSALFCAPGNAGTARFAETVPIKVDEIDKLCAWAQEQRIDLTVVGPEYPLTLGLSERFKAAGLTVFGPSRQGVQLESSKSFAKEVMVAAGVPTAEYKICDDEEQIRAYLKTAPIPTVLKADGLASGKGVFVCMTRNEAMEAVDHLFGELKSERVVVEQHLLGIEASFIVATDGRRIVPLAPAHDYKRIFDGDRGPNTGGMGTVSPTPRLSSAQAEWSIEHVIRPVLVEMERRGIPFSGFLYAGLMIAHDGTIKVLEFNARLGDPETQVIMRRLDSDLAALLYGLATGGDVPDVAWRDEAAVCVVLASEGYPAKGRLGDVIDGIQLAETMSGVVVFHAGTERNESGDIITSGGRVLNVTATGKNVDEARSRAYRAADIIQFKGRQLRRDIGLN